MLLVGLLQQLIDSGHQVIGRVHVRDVPLITTFKSRFGNELCMTVLTRHRASQQGCTNLDATTTCRARLSESHDHTKLH